MVVAGEARGSRCCAGWKVTSAARRAPGLCWSLRHTLVWSGARWLQVLAAHCSIPARQPSLHRRAWLPTDRVSDWAHDWPELACATDVQTAAPQTYRKPLQGYEALRNEGGVSSRWRPQHHHLTWAIRSSASPFLLSAALPGSGQENSGSQAERVRSMGLPLRMNTLHAPTVPSGPTSAARTNGQAGHLSFAELQRKKDDTEAELKALGAVLDSVQFIIMTSPRLRAC